LNGQREFEGLQFTSNGSGYLLVNKGAELMQTTHATF